MVVSYDQFSSMALRFSSSNGCGAESRVTSISSTGRTTSRGKSKLMRMFLCEIECNGDGAVVGCLRPVPTDPREAFDLLPGGKGRAVGLSIADDIWNRLCIASRQGRWQQNVIQLAQVPLLRSARVIQRPAIHFRPSFHDVLAKAVSQQDIETGTGFVRHREPIAGNGVSLDHQALPVIITVATNRPALAGSAIL